VTGHRRRPGPPLGGVCLTVALGLVLAACSGGPPATSGPGRQGGEDTAITIGSFNFPESELLANLYGEALRAHGFDVRILANVGAREQVEPALANGLVQFVPEYAGSALGFLTLGSNEGSSDVEATRAALEAALLPLGLAALESAQAQDANAIVVTRATAAKYGLRTISDLAPVASDLTFGAPPECPQRPFCLMGLRASYGLRFHRFVGLDSGGPLTLTALRAREIDVALLFSTDPSIAALHLVVLQDDRQLQPAENVTPIVHRDLLARYGSSFVQVVDDVSARLTEEQLRLLNARVAAGTAVSRAVSAWLDAEGLVPGGSG